MEKMTGPNLRMIEDDGEDMYLPDPLEVAQLEVGNDKQSLNDSIRHAPSKYRI